MNAYYKVRNFFIFFFLVLITASTSFAQSNSSTNLPPKAIVKKEISKDNFTLTFQNKIGQNEADFKSFENKVNQAGFSGLIKVKIDPKSNIMIAVFKPNATEKDVEIFFASVGYNDYIISQ